MMAWFIVIIVLWVYPILGLALFLLTKNKQALRLKTIKIIGLLSLIVILGLYLGISFTSSLIDWILVTSPLLFLCLIAWWSQFQKNELLKVFGKFGLVILFFLCFLSGSVGILGMGFVTAEYETDEELWLEDGIIFKELYLGNALSNHRIKRLEINKTIPWFPIIEWRLVTKEYNNFAIFADPLTVNYDKQNKQLFLSLEKPWRDTTYYWADTILIE